MAAGATATSGATSSWRTMFLLGALLVYAAALYYRDLSTTAVSGVAGSAAAAGMEEAAKALEVPADDEDEEELGERVDFEAPPPTQRSRVKSASSDDFDDDFGEEEEEEEMMENGEGVVRAKASNAPKRRVSASHTTQRRAERSAFSAIHNVHVRFCMA